MRVSCRVGEATSSENATGTLQVGQVFMISLQRDSAPVPILQDCKQMARMHVSARLLRD